MSDIAFIIIIGFVLVALCYTIINQMMLNNSVNKRLMALIEDTMAILGHQVSITDKTEEETEEEEHFDPYEVE